MELRWTTYFTRLALLCLLTALSACDQIDDETGGDQSAIISVGDRLPAFTLYGSYGEQLTSATLSGKVFILNFFDTRCPDCQQEFLVLQQIYDQYATTVPVVNVPRSQNREEVAAYWVHAGLTMPFYIPDDKDLYYQFASAIIPRTYVIGADCRVAAAFDDSPIADRETLDALLQNLLGGDTGTVRLSLRVNVAASGDVGDYYFHNEYTVSRLELYFFDAHTKQFFTKAVATGLTQLDDTPDTQYDITYIFEDLRLRAGVYDIFAIANYNNSPDEVDSEARFLDLVDSITYRRGIDANIPDSGPVMTNRATSLLAIDLVPWIDKDYVLGIELERVMAKLQIGVSRNTFQLQHDQRKYADINITNYKMVNLNNRYYLFQHRDSLPEFTPRTTFDLPLNYSDYSDHGDLYVVDPLFYQKVPEASSANHFSDYYQSWYGNFTTSDFASMPSANNYGYAYVLENTSYKTAQKNGYSPGVVFKAAVSPVFVYLYDNNLRALKEEYRPEYWSNTIYLYNYNFYGSIQAVNVASGLTLDELQTYTDAQLNTYGIKQCRFNMGVYETYYTYWIRHRNNPDNPMGPMEYGIVRNNFYRMIVTGVTGIGNSSITPNVMRDNYPNSYTDVVIDFTTP